MYKNHLVGVRNIYVLKISVLLPKTQLEINQLPVKNICFCRHKPGWNFSRALLKKKKKGKWCPVCKFVETLWSLFSSQPTQQNKCLLSTFLRNHTFSISVVRFKHTSTCLKLGKDHVPVLVTTENPWR